MEAPFNYEMKMDRNRSSKNYKMCFEMLDKTIQYAMTISDKEEQHSWNSMDIGRNSMKNKLPMVFGAPCNSPVVFPAIKDYQYPKRPVITDQSLKEALNNLSRTKLNKRRSEELVNVDVEIHNNNSNEYDTKNGESVEEIHKKVFENVQLEKEIKQLISDIKDLNFGVMQQGEVVEIQSSDVVIRDESSSSIQSGEERCNKRFYEISTQTIDGGGRKSETEIVNKKPCKVDLRKSLQLEHLSGNIKTEEKTESIDTSMKDEDENLIGIVNPDYSSSENETDVSKNSTLRKKAKLFTRKLLKLSERNSEKMVDVILDSKVVTSKTTVLGGNGEPMEVIETICNKSKMSNTSDDDGKQKKSLFRRLYNFFAQGEWQRNKRYTRKRCDCMEKK